MSRLTVRDSDGVAHSVRVGYYDIIDKLAHYEDLEEQGLLLKTALSVENVIDKIFSHNEIISLWRKSKENGVTCHKRIWYGMAWDIPIELKSCEFVKYLGQFQKVLQTQIL